MDVFSVENSFSYYPDYWDALELTKQIKELSGLLTDNNGVMSIDWNNISIIHKILCLIDDISHCRDASWLRGNATYYYFKLLSHCHWDGPIVEFVHFKTWGPIPYDQDENQLAYYLYWRDNAKKGLFLQCTDSQLWLYTYDLILNMCFPNERETFQSLLILNNNYKKLISTSTSRVRNEQYHKTIVAEYCIYNSLVDEYNSLPPDFKIIDWFTVCNSIVNRSFNGTGEYLYTFSYSIQKSSNDSEIVHVLPQLLESILINYVQIDKINFNRIAHDLVGEKNTHCTWEPYNDTLIHPETLRKIPRTSTAINFFLNGNHYSYVVHPDRCRDKDMANTHSSWYYNDCGELFEKQGCYYHTKYEGATKEGKELIRYIIQRIRAEYRILRRKRSLKDVPYPYTSFKTELDGIIKQQVQSFLLATESVVHSEKSKTSDIFELDPNSPPQNHSAYKYARGQMNCDVMVKKIISAYEIDQKKTKTEGQSKMFKYLSAIKISKDEDDVAVDINVFSPKDLDYPGTEWTIETLNAYLTGLINSGEANNPPEVMMHLATMLYSGEELNLGSIIIRKTRCYDRVLWSHKMEYEMAKISYYEINDKFEKQDKPYFYSEQDELEDGGFSSKLAYWKLFYGEHFGELFFTQLED